MTSWDFLLSVLVKVMSRFREFGRTPFPFNLVFYFVIHFLFKQISEGPCETWRDFTEILLFKIFLFICLFICLFLRESAEREKERALVSES